MSQINFPNSPSDGDEFLASNGTTYQYDSNTGQWKILAGPGVQGPAGSSANIPTGMVMPFFGSTVPADWLECNGSLIPSQYTDLIALVGANVPDLRGEFIRGWDNGRGVDSGRAIRSTQGDDFKSHDHSNNSVGNHTHSYQKGGQGTGASGGSTGVHDFNSNSSTGGAGGHSHTIGSTGGTETRPRNIALMYCVKT